MDPTEDRGLLSFVGEQILGNCVKWAIGVSNGNDLYEGDEQSRPDIQCVFNHGGAMSRSNTEVQGMLGRTGGGLKRSSEEPKQGSEGSRLGSNGCGRACFGNSLIGVGYPR